MNKLIDETLKIILKDDKLIEKLLYIDNIDDLYDFFISQKSGYDKSDLVKYFVQIAKKNMVLEEDLENVSGGNINKKLSKSLCLSLSALTLMSFPAYASNDGITEIRPVQEHSQQQMSIKEKISEKLGQLKKTVQDHPIASTTIANSLVFLGLYKSIIDPQLKSLRRIENVEQVNQLAQDLQNLQNNINNENQQVRDQINQLLTTIRDFQTRLMYMENLEVRHQIENINTHVERLYNMMGIETGDIPAVERPYTEAHNLRAQANCKLGDRNGKTYLTNYITRINVNINNEADIANQLRDLCVQFNKTRGIHSNDSMDGWQRSAYQYFFTGPIGFYSHLFPSLSDYHKTILAQMIQAMYQNKDDPRWNETINTILNLLSQHDGHCSWRAEALVNESYAMMCSLISDNRLDNENLDVVRNTQYLLKSTFTDLKNKIIEEAKHDYLERNGRDGEPLAECNRIAAHLRFLLGITQTRPDHGDGEAQGYFNRLTSKKEIIRMSHDIISHNFEDEDRNILFRDIDQQNMYFTDYCKFVGKSHDEIELLINAVKASDNNNLKKWVNGECVLKLGGYPKVDRNGMPVYIRIGGGRRYDRAARAWVQSEPRYMQDTEGGIIDNLMELNREDFNAIGCPELMHAFGVKFIIMCFYDNYFDNRD